ncbi:MAG TPA: DUF5317 family protein [Candidatus Limnocylindrales bacterium]
MFLLYSILIGLALGLAVGGRVSRLGDLRLAWVPLAVLGLACQILLFAPPLTRVVGDIGPAAYVASTLLVLLVVVRNVPAVPALGLVVIGAACNLAAIVANRGFMPTTAAARAVAGRTATVGYSNSLDVANPALAPLVDRFATPAWLPFANVFSIGDVLIGLGVAAAIVVAMRTRPGQRHVPLGRAG